MKMTLIWWIAVVVFVIVGSCAHKGWRKDECDKCEQWKEDNPGLWLRDPCEDLCQVLSESADKA